MTAPCKSTLPEEFGGHEMTWHCDLPEGHVGNHETWWHLDGKVAKEWS